MSLSMLCWRGFYVGLNGAIRSTIGPTFAARGRDEQPQGTTAAEGNRDAEAACFLARIAGVQDDAVLYLDVDGGCTAAYLAAWVSGVLTRGLTPGVTGGSDVVAMLATNGIDLAFWVFCASSVDEMGQVVGEGIEQWVH